jgi:phage terminase large subunit-like protein
MVATLNNLSRFLTQRAAKRLNMATSLRADQREGLEKYCPHSPWPKQRAFLSLDCEEAFYGGAAGPGKTDALLMAALQYVHVPGYSAMILRRDFARLALAGAIMDRSKAWLTNTDARWNEQQKTWRFPSGATIQFGYIDNVQDRFRYASAEYQFIGWDELTEFQLTDDDSNPYLFMFSRLRKAEGVKVPLRVRSASNPGNIGHAWVKRRFVPEKLEAIDEAGHLIKAADGRIYVPAQIRDNPAINEERYKQSLMHLPPTTRARLMAGDWDVAENLQIPAGWFRDYYMQGELLCPIGGDGQRLEPIHQASCRRIATIDTAGTSRDKAEESRGKPPSWSVCGIWDVDRSRKTRIGDKIIPAPYLYLRHVWRDRVGWNELKVRVPELLREWNVKSTRIENAHVGPPLRDELKGFPDVQTVGPMLPGMADGYRGAKLERAIASGYLSMLEGGRVFLPQADSPWKSAFLNEHTSWDGSPDATCDQIDQAGYAAWEAKKGGSSWGGVVSAR